MLTAQSNQTTTLQAQERLRIVNRAMDIQSGQLVYAIVDTAADERLYGWLQLEPKESEVRCLYDGDPAIRYARYAPYLMTLHSDSPMFWRWTEQGLNQNWGIWLTSKYPSMPLKRHFKKFLTYVHQGKTAYLRFYDPRVLPSLLDAMTPGNCFDFFGGDLIHTYGALQTTPGALWLAHAVQEGWVQRSTNSAKAVSQVIKLFNKS